MQEILIYILIGLTGGVLCGLLGIGGGIIIVPALVFICGFNQLQAQGTSLAVLLPPIGILAFLEYYRQGHVNPKAALLIGITVFIGAFLGAVLVKYIPQVVLRKGFAFLLLIVSVKMFLGK